MLASQNTLSTKEDNLRRRIGTQEAQFSAKNNLYSMRDIFFPISEFVTVKKKKFKP